MMHLSLSIYRRWVAMFAMTFAIFLCPALAHAVVGSCVVSAPVLGVTITTISGTCTGGTAGDAGAIADTALGSFRGWIILVETNPGTTGPTDDYDIVINSASGVDVMGGALANRDTANTERATPALPGWVDGALTMVVSGNTAASSTFTFKIIIYREP